MVTAVTSASAQPKEDQAEQLFREGREALSRGDYATACPKFAESVRLTQRPGPLLNLAQCEEHQGQLRSALKHWRDGAAMLPAGDARIAVANEHVAALQPKLPRLTVKLSPDAPPGSKVTLDGAELSGAALGTPQELERGGDHVIVTTAPGRTDVRSTITLAEGEHREVMMVAGPEKPVQADPKSGQGPVAPPPTTDAPTHGAGWTAGFVIGGIGVASLVAGGVTGVLVILNSNTRQTQCPNNMCPDDAAKKKAEAATKAGQLFSIISPIALGVGAAGLGVGIALVATSSSKTPPVSATAALTALPGGAGFMMQGRF